MCRSSDATQYRRLLHSSAVLNFFPRPTLLPTTGSYTTLPRTDVRWVLANIAGVGHDAMASCSLLHMIITLYVTSSGAWRCVAVLKCAMTSAASLTYPHFMQASFVIALPLYIGQSVDSPAHYNYCDAHGLFTSMSQWPDFKKIVGKILSLAQVFPKFIKTCCRQVW